MKWKEMTNYSNYDCYVTFIDFFAQNNSGCFSNLGFKSLKV